MPPEHRYSEGPPSLTPDREAWSGRGTTHQWDLERRPWGPSGGSWTDRAYGGVPLSGPHVGRGPRGWRRSDEWLREQVNEALTRDPDVDATDIDVLVDDGEVTLSGMVDDRFQKRVAEECAAAIDGVHDVHNRLRVHRRE